MKAFTESGRQEFLADKHVAVLSIDASGDRPPASVPIWYDYTPGGDIRFNTGPGTRKARLIERAGAVTLVFMSASIPGDFAYVTELGYKDVGIGIVLSVWAIGMIVASNLLPQRIPAQALATATLFAAAVQGLAKFIAPFWTVFPFMVAWWLVGGAGHGLKNTGFRTLIHQRVPAEQHGRAFATFNGMRNTAELVALAAGGVLVTTVGARGTLWVAGGVSALAALAGVAALGRRREEPVALLD